MYAGFDLRNWQQLSKSVINKLSGTCTQFQVKHCLLLPRAYHYHAFLFSGSVNSPLDWTEDEWHSNLSTNLTGSWLVSKYVCKLMRDAKIKGCVINISSIGGLDRGQLPGSLGYAASKTGLNSITKVIQSHITIIKLFFYISLKIAFCPYNIYLVKCLRIS